MPIQGSDDNGRNQKLKSYDTKDYSETIDFPVELVDRDGVVRRYSYEESLAVYHRRIQSAPWRYNEEDLIRAEIAHCSRRIDQIKRSHEERSQTGAQPPSLNPRASLGQGYEILSRFYRAALQDRGLVVDGELPMKLSLLEDRPDCRTYHVGFGGGRSEHLLYVFPFDRSVDADPRLTYSAARNRYRGQIPGVGVEKLLLEEEMTEAGFILTGGTDISEGLRSIARDLNTSPTSQGRSPSASGDEGQPDWLSRDVVPRSDDDGPLTSFELGVVALRADRMEQALEHLRRAVEENPWHREGYLALLAVLDGAGLNDEAEMYGSMASHYLRDDGLVRYRLGINMVRQGRLEEAVESFDEAGELDDTLYQPGYFAAHLLLARGRDLDGAITRMELAARVAPGELRLDRLLLALRNIRRARWAMHTVGLSSALLAVILVARGHGIGWVTGVSGAVMFSLASPLSAAVARFLVRRRMADPPAPVSAD